MSLGCVINGGLCDRLTQKTKLNRLNERDLSLPVSISQIFIPGLDLNAVVFNEFGYVQNTTNVIKDVLDAGLRRLYLDVYWDTEGEKWHLCPNRPAAPGNVNSSTAANGTSTQFSQSTGSAENNGFTSLSSSSNSSAQSGNPSAKTKFSTRNENPSTNNSVVCDYKFDFTSFLTALKGYIDMSDTNIAASLIYLHLRPKLWDPYVPSNQTISSIQGSGQSSLNQTLGSVIGSRMLIPSQIRQDQVSAKQKESSRSSRYVEWPSLKTVLYTNTARLVVSYNNTLASTISDLNDLSSVAFAFSPTIDNPQNRTVDELTKLNFTDTPVHDEAGWLNARYAGVSPVLNNGDIGIYSPQLLDLLEQHEYWSWAANQPILYSIAQREDMLSDGYSKTVKLAACAVFGERGLEVANCNSHFPVLCRHKSNMFDWIYTEDNHTYFDPSCPDNYEFATPSTPLESRLIREFYRNSSSQNAWVDFNSLYLPNCWITGGTNAVCPYNIRQDNRNGIGNIIVAGVVSLCAFLLIFLFEWDRGKSPLMRKNLKRDKTRQAEFEGVPS